MGAKQSLSASFLLCEDIRSELHGKVTVVGLFPGGKVLLLKSPKKVKGFVGQVNQLAILAMIQGPNGNFPVSLVLTSPTNETVLDGNLGPVPLTEGRTGIIAFRMAPFMVPAFGTYRAAFTVGDKVLPFEFQIEGVSSLPDTSATAGRAKGRMRRRSKKK